MCGRYVLYTKKEALESRFHIKIEKDFVPNYNVAPSSIMPIITTTQPDVVTWGKWGFLPKWAHRKPHITSVINARAEGIEDKPFFREAIRKNRCLILVDGFYEWKKQGKNKVPYRFYLKTGEPFALAGLFEEYQDEHGITTNMYAIITSDANEIMQPIHTRMPVILSPDTEKEWLNNDLTESNFATILVPYNKHDLKTCEIGSDVNSVRHNNESLIECV